jgi:hypothetical protein
MLDAIPELMTFEDEWNSAPRVASLDLDLMVKLLVDGRTMLRELCI